MTTTCETVYAEKFRFLASEFGDLTLLFNGWKDRTEGLYLIKPNAKINSNTGNNIFKSKLDLNILLPNGACPMHCKEKLSTEAGTFR